MLGEDLKLGLSSLLTSPREQLTFALCSPNRIFLPSKSFCFSFSSLSVTRAIPSDGLQFRTFVLENTQDRDTQPSHEPCVLVLAWRLLSCLPLKLILNHFCIPWASISFSVKEEETGSLFVKIP